MFKKLKEIRLDLEARIHQGVTRARKFFERERSTQIVQFGKLEASFLQHQVDRWPKWQQLLKRGEEEGFVHFEELLRDIFFALYLVDPRVRHKDEVKPSYHVNLELLNQIQGLPIYHQARTRSMLDRTNSIIGLVGVAEQILNEMPQEAKDEVKDKQEQDEPDEKESEATRTLVENLQQILDNLPQLEQMSQEELEALQDQVGDLDALMDQMEAAAAAGAAISGDKARRMAKSAMDKANKDMADFEEMMVSWGVEPGEMRDMPIDKAMALYEKMVRLPNLREFTDELGRMRQHANEATSQIHAQEPHEIVDVTVGRSLTGLLPSERVQMVHPKLKSAFWARWAQEGLLNWEYAGREQAGKGPFIACVDVSGSTMGIRERWGKGFILAALDMAAKQRRDVAIIFFDATVIPEGIFVIEKGRAPLWQKVEIASFYTGGGTSFEAPLKIALENIEAFDGGWKEADIVLVTDGECRMGPAFQAEFNARRESLGVRVHGVLLDGHGGMLESLTPFCDYVTSVRSFDGPGTVVKLFDRFVGSHL